MANPSLRGAKATKQSSFPHAALWIASRSLSSGRAFARPLWLAMKGEGNTGRLTFPAHFGGRFRRTPSAPRYNPATPPSPSRPDIRACSGDRLFNRDRKALLDGLLSKHGSTSGEFLQIVSAQRSAAVSASPAGANLVDEAELKTLLGRDMARGQDHAHRALPARSAAAADAGRRRGLRGQRAGSGKAKVAFSER